MNGRTSGIQRMTTPNHRSLPIRAEPEPDEALDSWLDRTALTYGIPRSVLIKECALPSQLTNPRDATGGRLSSADLAELARVFRIDISRIRTIVEPAQTLETLAGPSGPKFHRKELKGRPSSPYCPECLSTHGTWRIAWRKPWITTCIHHNVSLIEHCQGCGHFTRSQPVRRHHTLSELADLTRCGHITWAGAQSPRHRCQFQLETAAAPPAIPAQIALTEYITTNEHRLSEPAVLADLDALRTLSARRRTDRHQPTTLVAAALGHRDSLASIVADMPNRNGLIRETMGASERLKREIARAVGLSSGPIAYLRAFPPACNERPLDPATIATYVPAGTWPSLIHEGLLAGGSHAPRRISAAIAVATVMVGNRANEAACRRLLGHDHNWNASSVLSKCDQRTEGAAFFKRIAHAAISANGHEIPIDYARRRKLDIGTMISPADWELLGTATGIYPSEQRLGTVRTIAAALLCGTPLEAMSHEVQLWRFLHAAPHETLARLMAHLAAKLDAAGIQEPVIWDPYDNPAIRVSTAAQIRHRIAAGESIFDIAPTVSLTPTAMLTWLAMSAAEISASWPTTPGVLPIAVNYPELAERAARTPIKPLARELHISSARLDNLLNLLDAPTRAARNEPAASADWLSTRYETTTLREIAKELGISGSAAGRLAKRHGVTTRRGTPSHASALQPHTTEPALSESLASATAGVKTHHLARFLLLETVNSFRELAQAIGTRRSSISASIAAVESAAGVTLVHRAASTHTAPMRYTEAGRRLARQLKTELRLTTTVQSAPIPSPHQLKSTDQLICLAHAPARPPREKATATAEYAPTNPSKVAGNF